MIVRVFKGQVRPGMVEAYRRFLLERAVPQFRARAGLESLRIGAPPDGADEFVVVTVWRDLASLRAFAGPRWERARMSADERRMLRRTTVQHYVDVTPPVDVSPDGVALAPGGEPYRALESGDLRLDLAGRIVRLNGSSFELPPREFQVLVELALHPGQPIPSDELARRAWPDAPAATGDDVRRIVYRLKRRLAAGPRTPVIRNRRGYGYVLEPPAAARR